MPLRNVVPKPLQKPHPPLWVACSALDTIEMAGRRGLGALAFQFLSADAAHAWVHAYYNAFTKRQEKLCDYVTNPNLAITSYFMCAETDEEARRRADGIPFFQFALRFYGQQANRRRPDPGTVNLWDEYEKWKRANPENHARALRGGLIGSPETLRDKLRKFETSHIDSVILLNQAGKNTHEHICESLDLFAREVMPEFHARIPEQEEWKAKVLAREIELEEIDTQPFRDRYGPNSVQLTPARRRRSKEGIYRKGHEVYAKDAKGLSRSHAAQFYLQMRRDDGIDGASRRRAASRPLRNHCVLCGT